MVAVSGGLVCQSVGGFVSGEVRMARDPVEGDLLPRDVTTVLKLLGTNFGPKPSLVSNTF